MPSSSSGKLAELTAEVWCKSGILSAQIPSAVVRERAARLVREMNSYYSNLIEGHKTLPRDIERALHLDYSENPDQRANQHLNRAHIEVETLMLERLRNDRGLQIHSAEFLCWLHREFYQRLPEELHWSTDRSDRKYKIKPGALREFEVVVGSHQPPHWKALPKFLARFGEVYAGKGNSRDSGSTRGCGCRPSSAGLDPPCSRMGMAGSPAFIHTPASCGRALTVSACGRIRAARPASARITTAVSVPRTMEDGTISMAGATSPNGPWSTFAFSCSKRCSIRLNS